MRTLAVFALLFAVGASLTLLAVSPTRRSSRVLPAPPYPLFSGHASPLRRPDGIQVENHEGLTRLPSP